jgi:hypothetical protein
MLFIRTPMVLENKWLILSFGRFCRSQFTITIKGYLVSHFPPGRYSINISLSRVAVYHQVVNWTQAVNRRSAGDSSESDTDMVELEKSNILVMGPTGSGTCSDHWANLFLLLNLYLSPFTPVLTLFSSKFLLCCCNVGQTFPVHCVLRCYIVMW